MRFKAILFDLDGTLLDTLADLADAMNRVLAQRGFPTHPMDAYRYFVGDGASTLVARTLPEEARREDTIRACLDAFKEDYDKNWNIKTKPYDGVLEMLNALVARKVKMAVLSNKPHDATVRCVEALLADWEFDAVLGQRDGVPRKPDPAGAVEIAERLDIPPGEFLYLGDTGGDMKTARAAGMFPVGVSWGFRPVRELRENGARSLLTRPEDLVSLLD